MIQDNIFNWLKKIMDSDLPLVSPELVMLVDDDSFMLELMADMLLQLGVLRVQKMADVRSALRAMQGAKPDLLICDLCMPDTDGIEFLDQLAHSGFHGWVMLYSGAAPAVVRAAEKLAQVRGLKLLGAFSKPLTADALRAALAKVFQLDKPA